jgi:hypothetical protein
MRSPWFAISQRLGGSRSQRGKENAEEIYHHRDTENTELRKTIKFFPIPKLRVLCVFVVISTLCVLPSPSVSSPVRFELSQIRTILDRLSGQLTWR